MTSSACRRRRRRSTTRSSAADCLYREQLPLLPGAVDAVERLAGRVPLGIATSSNRPIIDLVLELAGLAPALPGRRCRPRRSAAASRRRTSTSRPRAVWVSPAGRCAAIEDSHNGHTLRHAAGNARRRDPQPRVPAGRRGARPRRRRARLDRGAQPEGRGRISSIPSLTVSITHSTRWSTSTLVVERANVERVRVLIRGIRHATRPEDVVGDDQAVVAPASAARPRSS